MSAQDRGKVISFKVYVKVFGEHDDNTRFSFDERKSVLKLVFYETISKLHVL